MTTTVRSADLPDGTTAHDETLDRWYVKKPVGMFPWRAANGEKLTDYEVDNFLRSGRISVTAPDPRLTVF
ncbi:hypothetical protein [Paractinoplanes brasiliensis]|uniref:Uncharacterized protein n=1 Tax=Paractinoplanes brasiliensis TaxID=52695 RepID=A0A4R6JAZ6_9ACTN|nr:hypothetical protein [Actinoplanes brasiliensis]TDO32849.1 hypothetical protein C8E87_8321 [Actinoplanes brasiliensis]GID31606.1 hypothetical protein Abr02nite_65890 [Actinoplanes brasiliensis]